MKAESQEGGPRRNKVLIINEMVEDILLVYFGHNALLTRAQRLKYNSR